MYAYWYDKEAQKRLIQTFVNAVFVYDDHITLTYNFSGDKSTITLHDMQRVEDGEEFGCRASRSTKTHRYELFWFRNVFGLTRKLPQR